MRLSGLQTFKRRADALQALARDVRSLPAKNLKAHDAKFCAVQKAHFKTLEGRGQYVRSGELRDSLVSANHSNHLARVDAPNRITLGTSVPYSVYLKGRSRRGTPVIRMRRSDVRRVFIKPLVSLLLQRYRRALRGHT